jgi:Xaa-Pro dipeptidase
MLTTQGCANRRKRLQQELEASGCDLFVTGGFRTAYYFTGVLSTPEQPVVFAMRADGATTLVTSAQPGHYTGELIPVEFYSIARTITQPFHDAAKLFSQAMASRTAHGRCAVELSSTGAMITSPIQAEIADATEMVLRLRKKKEEDEIDEIRFSLRCCAAAYKAARETILPGLTEIDVYNAMYAAVTKEAGAPVLFPGDFACGERCIRGGGPPTGRVIQQGDLYILDLFPAPALYAGDVCRTFAVGEPTEIQRRAWELVREATIIGEKAIRPGVRARDVYARVKEFLDAQEPTEKSFWHHAGHGIGHNSHEAPRIIPGTDDLFEVGDVITLEPGVYSRALQGGIRLEDNYVVREGGLDNLFDFPLGL